MRAPHSTFAAMAFAAGLFAANVPALAAPITEAVTITASGFTDLIGQNTPITDPYRLSFLLSFDPAMGDQFDRTGHTTLLTSSLPVAGGLSFDYASALDELTVGGRENGTDGISGQTKDVLFVIDHASSNAPVFNSFYYTGDRNNGLFQAASGTVSVPEPAALGLLGAAVLLLGLIRRRA